MALLMSLKKSDKSTTEVKKSLKQRTLFSEIHGMESWRHWASPTDTVTTQKLNQWRRVATLWFLINQRSTVLPMGISLSPPSSDNSTLMERETSVATIKRGLTRGMERKNHSTFLTDSVLMKRQSLLESMLQSLFHEHDLMKFLSKLTMAHADSRLF